MKRATNPIALDAYRKILNVGGVIFVDEETDNKVSARIIFKKE